MTRLTSTGLSMWLCACPSALSSDHPAREDVERRFGTLRPLVWKPAPDVEGWGGGALTSAAISIRAEIPSDINAIHAVEAAAFGREGEAGLVDALRELQNG